MLGKHSNHWAILFSPRVYFWRQTRWLRRSLFGCIYIHKHNLLFLKPCNIYMQYTMCKHTILPVNICIFVTSPCKRLRGKRSPLASTHRSQTLILYSKYGHFDFTHRREGVFFPLQIKPRATRRLSKCCVTELHPEPNKICNLNPKLKKNKNKNQSFDPKPHKTLHLLFRMEAFKA